MAAPTVDAMSSCRATSFYLAPGVMRYFRDHTLVAVLPDGTWVEIRHRADIARLQKSRPDWDGTVLCSAMKFSDLSKMRERFLQHPASVERWNIDQRVVEGRRPADIQFPLHRLHWGGLETVGGVRQLVEAVMPGANKPLRKAAESLLEEHRELGAFRLSVVAAMRGVVSDDELAMMLAAWSPYESANWAPVDIARFRSAFLRMTETQQDRRAVLLTNLLNGSSLSDDELELALSSSQRPIDEHTQAMLAMRGPDVVARLLRRVPEMSTTLLGELLWREDVSHEVNLHLSRRGLPLEVARTLLDEPALLRRVQTYAHLDEALFELLLEPSVRGGSAKAPLENLARNESLSAEMQMRIASEGDTTSVAVLARNPKRSGDEALEQALLARAKSANENEELHRLDILKGLCSGETISSELVKELVKMDEQCVRILGARHDLPEEGVMALYPLLNSREQKKFLERIYIYNPAAVSSAFERLVFEASDTEMWVLLAANSHHDETQARLRSWVENADSTKTEVVLTQAAILAGQQHIQERQANEVAFREEQKRMRQEALEAQPEREKRVERQREQRLAHERANPTSRKELRDEVDIHRIVRLLDDGTRGVHHPIENTVSTRGIMKEWETTGGEVLTVQRVQHIQDLPGVAAAPFYGISRAQQTLNGYEAVVTRADLDGTEGLGRPNEDLEPVRVTARVLNSEQVVRHNAEYMGNCTGGYVDGIARGDVRLVGMYDDNEQCILNVELRRENGRWRAGEVNTRFNGYGMEGNPPERVQQIADQLAERMNNATMGGPD